MSDSPVDSGKRTWLIASGCAGAVGVGFTAVPFVSTFQPSERARAAGAAVEVDISGLKPGEKLTVEHAIKGIRAMPAKGGNPDLEDIEVQRAVAFDAVAGVRVLRQDSCRRGLLGGSSDVSMRSACRSGISSRSTW